MKHDLKIVSRLDLPPCGALRAPPDRSKPGYRPVMPRRPCI